MSTHTKRIQFQTFLPIHLYIYFNEKSSIEVSSEQQTALVMMVIVCIWRVEYLNMHKCRDMIMMCRKKENLISPFLYVMCAQSFQFSSLFE